MQPQEVTWGMITGTVTILLGIGAVFGVVALGAYRRFMSGKADLEREQHDLRDDIRGKYKELYEVERERNKQLLARISDLEGQLRAVEARLRELADESRRLQELNLKYQEDKRQDGHKVRNLEQEVSSLRDRIEGTQAT